jgi:hypothetical protein
MSGSETQATTIPNKIGEQVGPSLPIPFDEVPLQLQGSGVKSGVGFEPATSGL